MRNTKKEPGWRAILVVALLLLSLPTLACLGILYTAPHTPQPTKKTKPAFK